jgi:hypothetical protein
MEQLLGFAYCDHHKKRRQMRKEKFPDRME